jgi:hypothetical protein
MIEAENKMIEARTAAQVAEAVFNAQTRSYHALERSLAPKPRKKASKPEDAAQTKLTAVGN